MDQVRTTRESLTHALVPQERGLCSLPMPGILFPFSLPAMDHVTSSTVRHNRGSVLASTVSQTRGTAISAVHFIDDGIELFPFTINLSRTIIRSRITRLRTTD